MNISKVILACAILFMAAACVQKSAEDRHGSQDIENAGNQELYNDIMEIHDEVMPKMNDLYKEKTALKTRLELPGISETEKLDINNRIVRIDSASESMMVWMRQFDPSQDSDSEEKARAYLEAELVKVKKVREEILEALKTTQ